MFCSQLYKTLSIDCTCDPKGTENGDQCAHKQNGQCRCKFGVEGDNCNECRNGYYGFGLESTSGCKSRLILT